MHKEDHQIFVVTGSESKTTIKPNIVFQEYNFPHSSPNIAYIMENVEPEVIILTGALDNPREISDYLAGVTNVVHDLKNPKLKQVIYLSSLSVFSGNTESVIDENVLPSPMEDWEKALVMGEQICLEYDHHRKFKVNILRFTPVYGTYNDDYVGDNILTKISKQIMRNEEIQIDSNKTHMLLYLDDAVDALYKVMGTRSEEDQIYHIGPDRRSPYSEEEIMIIFDKKVKHNRPIQLVKNNQEVLDQEYNLEKIGQLGFNEKHRIKNKLDSLYKTIEKSEDQKESVEKERISILSRIFKIDGEIKNRILPYIENLLFFIVLNIFLYFTQSMSIHEVIDFYLLYVIVVGIIYGYEQTIFTVILSVIAKRYITFSWDVRVLALPDYFTYMWILQLFSIGVLVGYIKEQYKIKRSEMTDENAYLKEQINDIKDINQSNKAIKDLYEERLLNYKDSFGRIYEIVSELDETEPKGIMFKAVGVIEKVMSTKDVSIYISGGDSGFFRLVASSSKKAKALKNSMKIADHVAFFEKLEKKQIYINTKIDPNYPMMAQGIYKGDQLESIIMVWSLPFGSNNLYQMNVFGITCKLIESSFNTAYEYMANIKELNHLQYENVLNKESFDKVLEVYEYGHQEGIVDFHISCAKRNENMSEEEFVGILRGNIRDTDYIGMDSSHTMRVLLTNTSEKDSAYVIDRLEKDGISVEEGEFNKCT